MASGRLVDYIGHGNIADRPATPDLATDSIGIWWSDDTSELSVWDGSAWQENVGGVPTAADVAIADAGGYFTGTDVEAALQELGAGGGGGGGGVVRQMVYTRDGTEVNTSNIIPLDSTTPQNTEGAEYTQIATSFTPTDAASILEIEFFCSGYYMGANSNTIWAMFKDSDANAIAVVNKTPANTGYEDQVRVSLFVVAGSTTARTYKIRYGSTAGDTVYVNARNTLAAPVLGIGLFSHMKITEYAP